PLADGSIKLERRGRSGAALRFGQSGKNAQLFYDGPGNIHPARGTCSLWYLPDGEEGGQPYVRRNLIGASTALEGCWGCVMIWGERLTSGRAPVTHCYASLFDGGRGLRMAAHKAEGKWRKGEWRHLAWVWDSRMGMKV